MYKKIDFMQKLLQILTALYVYNYMLFIMLFVHFFTIKACIYNVWCSFAILKGLYLYEMKCLKIEFFNLFGKW